LPELATSAVAAVRGHSDVAVGNVVGSNIFNALLIIGVAATVAPMQVPAGISPVDVAVMLGVSVAAAVVLWRGRLGRAGGAIGLVGYAAYVLVAYL
jgi:cation:H+ antiporter